MRHRALDEDQGSVAGALGNACERGERGGLLSEGARAQRHREYGIGSVIVKVRAAVDDESRRNGERGRLRVDRGHAEVVRGEGGEPELAEEDFVEGVGTDEVRYYRETVLVEGGLDKERERARGKVRDKVEDGAGVRWRKRMDGERADKEDKTGGDVITCGVFGEVADVAHGEELEEGALLGGSEGEVLKDNEDVEDGVGTVGVDV